MDGTEEMEIEMVDRPSPPSPSPKHYECECAEQTDALNNQLIDAISYYLKFRDEKYQIEQLLVDTVSAQEVKDQQHAAEIQQYKDKAEQMKLEVGLNKVQELEKELVVQQSRLQAEVASHQNARAECRKYEERVATMQRRLDQQSWQLELARTVPMDWQIKIKKATSDVQDCNDIDKLRTQCLQLQKAVIKLQDDKNISKLLSTTPKGLKSSQVADLQRQLVHKEDTIQRSQTKIKQLEQEVKEYQEIASDNYNYEMEKKALDKVAALQKELDQLKNQKNNHPGTDSQMRDES